MKCSGCKYRQYTRAENDDALDGYSGGITVRHNADGTIMGYLGDKRRDREF